MRAATHKRTLTEQVAEELKQRILSGAHAPGSKLPPEPALAALLDVNRFTVREALNQLEQMRLVERTPGVGTVVLDYSEHASLDVLEYLVLKGGVVDFEVLGELLESAWILASEVAALAAERRTEPELAELRAIAERLRGEVNLSRLFWLDFDFNVALVGSAHNIVPRLVMNSVRGLLAKYTHLLETLWASPGTIAEGYEHVVEAVARRDAERARALVRWIWTARHHRFMEAAERWRRVEPATRTGHG